MSNGGWGYPGVSGQSEVYRNLPYAGYRDRDGWFEEWIESFASQFEIWQAAYISADARARLLDPADTTEEASTSYLASNIQAPTLSKIKDTMLDVLAFMALGTFPIDSNLSVAQKRAVIAIGAEALRRKGVYPYLKNLVAQIANGCVAGWPLPGWSTGFMVNDGAGSPGFGDWCSAATAIVGTVATTNGNATVTGTSTQFQTGWAGAKIRIGAATYTISNVASTTSLTLTSNAIATASGLTAYIILGAKGRPWLFQAARNVSERAIPSTTAYGLGPSQFRAGYSGAGEPVYVSGARMGILSNENFSAWSGGAPTGWSKNGTAALCAEDQTSAVINHEFTDSCAKMDLSAATVGQYSELTQTVSYINNQVRHIFELDYTYTNAQAASILTVSIFEVNLGGTTYYWDPDAEEWTTTVTRYAIPVDTSTLGRARWTTTITPLENSDTTADRGQQSMSVAIRATCDGTATTQTTYRLFRAGLFEESTLSVDAAAAGDRTAWYPLRDSRGWTQTVRSGSQSLVEPQNYNRSSVKIVDGSAITFEYHPALSGQAYRAAGAWTNLLKGTIVFTGDWTATNATKTANSEISPIVGETSATAVKLTATSTGAQIAQATGVTPTSKSYIMGCWVKKLSTDGNYTDVTFRLRSTATYSKTFTVTQAEGWKLLTWVQTLAGSDIAAMTADIRWGAASTNGEFAVWGAFLYDVTGKTDVRYPPVVISSAGATSTIGETSIEVRTYATGSDLNHPLYVRPLASIERGLIRMTVVPSFGATSQPDGTLIDICETTTTNRLILEIVSGVIRLKRWDDASNTTFAGLTLTTSDTPTATQCTWKRDTAIAIYARYDDDGSISLSVGDSSTSEAATGDTYDDASTAYFTIGCDIPELLQFEGLIRDVEVLTSGEPAA